MTEITNSIEILVLSPISSLDISSSLGILIPIIAVSLPAIIVLIVFVFESRNKKNKYNTIIEVSKNLSDPEEIRDLIESLQDDKKKSPTDLRRSGVITIFIGAGLFMLGFMALGGFFHGVGALVALIGVGQMFAGYLYPNTGLELTAAVEEYEKQ